MTLQGATGQAQRQARPLRKIPRQELMNLLAGLFFVLFGLL